MSPDARRQLIAAVVFFFFVAGTVVVFASTDRMVSAAQPSTQSTPMGE